MSAQHLINIYRKEVMIACVHFYVFFTLFFDECVPCFSEPFFVSPKGNFCSP